MASPLTHGAAAAFVVPLLLVLSWQEKHAVAEGRTMIEPKLRAIIGPVSLGHAEGGKEAEPATACVALVMSVSE